MTQAALSAAVSRLIALNIPGLESPPQDQAALIEWIKRGAIAAQTWAQIQAITPDDGSVNYAGFSYRDDYAADFIRVILSNPAAYLSNGFPVKFENPDRDDLTASLNWLKQYGLLTQQNVDDITWLSNKDDTRQLANLRLIPRFDKVLGGGSASDCRVTQTPEQCFEFTFDGFTSWSCQPGFEIRACDIYVQVSPALFPVYWVLYRRLAPSRVLFTAARGFYFSTATDEPALTRYMELLASAQTSGLVTFARRANEAHRRMAEAIAPQMQDLARRAGEARKKSDRGFWIEFVVLFVSLATGLSALASAMAGPGLLSTQGLSATVRVVDAFPGVDLGDVAKAINIYARLEQLPGEVLTSFADASAAQGADMWDFEGLTDYVDTGSIDVSDIDLGDVFEESGGFDWLDSMQVDLSDLINLGFDPSTFTLPVEDVDLFETFVQSGGVFYDDLGNGIDQSGFFTEVTPETYAGSLWFDEGANLRDMSNNIVATSDELAAIPADEPGILDSFIGGRLDGLWGGQNSLVPQQGTGARPASIGAPSPNGLSILGNIQNGWQALIAGLQIAPQIYREYRNARNQVQTQGRYMPNTRTSSVGTVNPQVPGQRITLADGSVAVRQPNGQTVIQRPDGTTQTVSNSTRLANPEVSTTFGIDNRLLIGGAVAIGAALLILRRK